MICLKIQLQYVLLQIFLITKYIYLLFGILGNLIDEYSESIFWSNYNVVFTFMERVNQTLIS